MAGVEDGMVLIKKPNGEIFKAKLDALSPADVDYVNEVSFGSTSEPKEGKTDVVSPAATLKSEKTTTSAATTPSATNSTSKIVAPSSPAKEDLFGDATSAGKVVRVTLIVDPNPLGPSIKELGVSPRPKLNDKVELNVNMANRKNNQEILPDSAWTIEALDCISGTLKPRTDALQSLKTDGMFYFLTYSVENNTQGPLSIPIPIVSDSKNRKFYPLSAKDNDADAYVPDGMLSAEKDILPPGLKKRFCSIYELPKDCVVCNIDVFPIRITRNPLYGATIRGGQLQGKSIDVRPDVTAPAEASSSVSKTDNSSDKASIFMSCRPKMQKGSSSTYTKTRVLSYTVDLRLTKPKQKDVTLKAYFIATDSEGEAIADIIDQEISLPQGKAFSTTLESKPITEGSIYTESYGSKLKGVIIQLWADGAIVATWTSTPQWDKFAKLPDIQLKMRKVIKRPTIP
ncbi:MAG: hypothetical protein WCJ02_12255 [bacterium]